RYLGAAGDSRDPTRINAVGLDYDARAVIEWIDLAAHAVHQWHTTQIFSGLTELAPGVLLSLSGQNVYVVHPEDATVVLVDGEREEGFDHSFLERASAGGVAWAVGRMSLARIVSTALGPRVESFSNELSERSNRIYNFDAVVAVNSDEVYLAGENAGDAATH